ncbi:MAG: hydrogen peroxide-inducible genes activator [Pseudomonadota bacterium]|nr:hydrogen peroxide-inducible genes activator [Pseudomonadota bacterium]
MRDLNLSLKQLRYFLMASQHSSLRKAATELKITQPSLSAQLKLLEDTLGVTLFERTRGGVSLTPIGRDLIPEARQAVNAAEAILDFANIASHGPAGTFRLGVPPSLGPYSLPFMLPAVRQSYRSVKFFIREAVNTELTEGLKTGVYDLVITTLPVNDPALTVVPLFREAIYLVTSIDHPLAKGPGTIRAEQLEGLEILAMEEHHLMYKQVEELCSRFNAKLLRDYEGTSLDAIRQMVFLEMGVAFLPGLYVRSEIRERNDLAVLSIEGESIYRVHALAWRKTSPLRNFFRGLAGFFQKVCKKEFGDDIVLQ